MSVYREHIKRAVRAQRILHSATIELTYKCNLDCFFCYNDRFKQGNPLSLEQYETLLSDMARMQTLFLMLSGGEPMIHPHFFAIGRKANDLGFVTRIRTNGHSMSKRIATRLKQEVDPHIVEVSLHGGTAQIHDRQTRVPGSFDRLVRNIGNALEASLQVSVVSTPTAWNEGEVDKMFELCDLLGVPLRFQGPVNPRDNGDLEPLTIQPQEKVWDAISREFKKRHIENRATRDSEKRIYVDMKHEKDEVKATCGVGVDGVDIDPYGNVQACMHLQESAGNLHENSIEEIWNHSPLFTRARNRAIDAAKHFEEIPVKQLGAPLFCLAVEENCNKGCTNGCGLRK